MGQKGGKVPLRSILPNRITNNAKLALLCASPLLVIAMAVVSTVSFHSLAFPSDSDGPSRLLFMIFLPLRGAFRASELLGSGFSILLLAFLIGVGFLVHWLGVDYTWNRVKYVLFTSTAVSAGFILYCGVIAEEYVGQDSFRTFRAFGLGNRGDEFTYVGLWILGLTALAFISVLPRWERLPAKLPEELR